MEEKLICITTVKSRIEAEQMLSFLKENGIYAAIQGGVPELYTGDSVSGDKIMVSAAHKEKAQKLLENFSPVETRASDPGRQTTKSRKLDTLGNHSRNIGLCSNPPAVNTAFLYDIL